MCCEHWRIDNLFKSLLSVPLCIHSQVELLYHMAILHLHFVKNHHPVFHRGLTLSHPHQCAHSEGASPCPKTTKNKTRKKKEEEFRNSDPHVFPASRPPILSTPTARVPVLVPHWAVKGAAGTQPLQASRGSPGAFRQEEHQCRAPHCVVLELFFFKASLEKISKTNKIIWPYVVCTTIGGVFSCTNFINKTCIPLI